MSQEQYDSLICSTPVPQEAWDRLVLQGQARISNVREIAAPVCHLVPELAHQSEKDLGSFDRSARFFLKISVSASCDPQTPRFLYGLTNAPDPTYSTDQFSLGALTVSLRHRNLLPPAVMGAPIPDQTSSETRSNRSLRRVRREPP